MELIDLIGKIQDEIHIERICGQCFFPYVQLTECLDSKFERQVSQIDGVVYEYCWESDRGDYGRSGELAVPFGEDGQYCLVFEYFIKF